MRRTASEFHNRSVDTAALFLNKNLSSGAITQADYDLITKFLNYKLSFDDIAETRYHKICQHLVWWRHYLPEFPSCTIDDIVKGIGDLKNAKTTKGDKFSNMTLRDYISILKMFLRWLNKQGLSEITRDEISEISLPKRKNKKNIVIFKDGEVEKMIDSCRRIRDRAMISLLYEGGFRIGEIGTMVWDQVVFDDYGLIVKEDFKTGKQRALRLAMSKHDLVEWKNEYCKYGEPYGDSSVFLNEKSEPYNYRALEKHLKRIAERAGVETKFTPHSFRHTRITNLKREGISDAIVGLMMWGDPTAPELSTYNQMNFEDVNSTMLEHYGISAPVVKHEKSLPRQCPKCHEINPPRFSFCGLCGEPLSKEAIDNIDMVKTSLTCDEDIRYAKFKAMMDRYMTETGQ
ncbi:tyrosine-type recombinase/integrase [Methanoplanus sp. FWC-SCC4]|uniref:Tyrosine-type recombinase/integrase n=1 Tax=Methanochimaera problematica TaxID=2609417 RepID=A0AA97FCG7_9EURY|nr:site-specific integrase [Methanoplanus sp. FWC-SCC4]WOF15977.1 tyrosine-type recombinase/integrase [Methanoplanus sp. FWC-SCC4]